MPVWGLEPSDSAYYALRLFNSENFEHILVPGVGYGRNAGLFADNGFQVTGIEISGKAIEQAKKLEYTFHIHLGSVCDMPFDNNIYDGIFCYAVLHLLNKYQRKRFLKACYNQLQPNGLMIFTVISTESELITQGKLVSNNRYLMKNGLGIYFYDESSILKEFNHFGLVDYQKIDEPIKFKLDEKPIKCFIITCKKKEG